MKIFLTFLFVIGFEGTSVFGKVSPRWSEWIDPKFSVDPRDLQVDEMSQNIQRISGAVMGTAELVIGIKSDLKLLRKEVILGKANGRFEGRNDHEVLKEFPAQSEEEKIRHNLALADRIEKLLQVENNVQVDLAREEIKKTIQLNFVRVLATMLISGPPRTQERKEDILQLMRSVLNGDLDFNPVVEKLPFILRDSETSQFINLVKTLKEDEVLKKFREGDDDDDGEEKEAKETVVVAAPPQVASVSTAAVTTAGATAPATQAQAPVPQKSGYQHVVDAVGQLDVSQLASILTMLPEVFEGVESIVGGFEGFLGDIVRR